MSEEANKQENNGQKPGDAKPSGAEKKAAEMVENDKILEAASAKIEEPEIDTADDLKQQLDAQSDRYLRLMAEFDNFKKRVSRDYERLVESANEKLVGELIDVRENFERALKTGREAGEGDSFFDGMKLIFSKFNDILMKSGLEPFGASGEPFDPQLHNALMKVPNETVPEDHIVEVFEKGYHLKKRVIRHAKVIVSDGAPKRVEGAEENKQNGK
jgi:molecular chaperone GrpE